MLAVQRPPVAKGSGGRTGTLIDRRETGAHFELRSEATAANKKTNKEFLSVFPDFFPLRLDAGSDAVDYRPEPSVLLSVTGRRSRDQISPRTLCFINKFLL